jgi:hypothetical protein
MYINRCDIVSKCNLEGEDLLVIFLSTAAHDVNHPGNNNFFEIKRKTKLATLYNDMAVLENHHSAFLFGLMHTP